MLEVSYDLAAFLLAASFTAGFIDAIAGGGGLITVPALIIAGAAPVQAIGTNKLQAVFGAATAAWSYARAGQVDPRRQIGAGLIAFLAGMAGAFAVWLIPTDAVRVVLPVVLVAIALFFAFKPGLNDLDRAERMRPALFTACIVPLIGFYDGLLGPGAGAFYMIGFVTLAGYGVLKATANTKFLNFASNLGGLVAFLMIGAPWWKMGLLMAVTQVLGARLGAACAVRAGAKLIKPLLVVTSSALAAKLIWDML